MRKNQAGLLADAGEAWQDMLGRLGFQPGRKCPKCLSLIYSRKSGRCGHCGEMLPEAFRMNGAQKARLDALLEQDRQSHRAWMNRHAPKSFSGLAV